MLINEKGERRWKQKQRMKNREIKRQRQRQKCYLEKKGSASRKNVVTKIETRGQEGTEMLLPGEGLGRSQERDIDPREKQGHESQHVQEPDGRQQ